MIAKCTDNKCPSRSKCYRYRIPEKGSQQPYADFHHDPRTKDCEYFWNVSGFHDTVFLSTSDADNVINRRMKK